MIILIQPHCWTSFIKDQPPISIPVAARTSDDPACSCPNYSEQTEGGLAQTAAICKNHCPGHTLAASGGLIPSTQLFPFVTADCGWALYLVMGLWAKVGTLATAVNKFCVSVHSGAYWLLMWWIFNFWGFVFDFTKWNSFLLGQNWNLPYWGKVWSSC